MYLFARVRTVHVVQWLAWPRKVYLVSPLWYVLVPLAQSLVRTGNVPIRPCLHCACCTVARLAAENVPSFSALIRTGTPCTVLGPHGQCTYFPCPYCAGTVVQCFAWSARAMYHLPGLVLVLISLFLYDYVASRNLDFLLIKT